MNQDSLLASIGGMLRRFKRAEAWLRKAGLPTSLARVPVWILCLQYCLMMRGKTARIARIGERIGHWLETITGLSHNEKARLELLDMDRGMRNDIESTKRTLLLLRELCVDVGGLFDSIGFKSRILAGTQQSFLAVVEESCATATTLQRVLDTHDARALALLREMAEVGRPSDGGTGVAAKAVAEAEAGVEAPHGVEVQSGVEVQNGPDAMPGAAAGIVPGVPSPGAA